MTSKVLVAALLCMLVASKSSGQTCSHGDVRLRGGTEFAGRVEVCDNGTWGTICDKGWDHQDAQVVCKQLNLRSSESPGPIGCQEACFGEGTGPVHYRDIECPPTAMSISDCTNSSVGLGVCNNHTRDVGAICILPTDNVRTSSCEMGHQAAVGGALGAVIGIMALLLGGAVVGWMVTCHKLKIKGSSTMLLNETISRKQREFDTPTYQINTSSLSMLEPQENLVIMNELSSDKDPQYIALGQNPDSTFTHV